MKKCCTILESRKSCTRPATRSLTISMKASRTPGRAKSLSKRIQTPLISRPTIIGEPCIVGREIKGVWILLLNDFALPGVRDAFMEIVKDRVAGLVQLLRDSSIVQHFFISVERLAQTFANRLFLHFES